VRAPGTAVPGGEHHSGWAILVVASKRRGTKTTGKYADKQG